jgi:hypothetical protein
VIDGGTVWYGELPLLAPERDEDLRALRFHSPTVAHELLADAGLDGRDGQEPKKPSM